MPEPSRGTKTPVLLDYLKIAAGFAVGAAVFAFFLFGVILHAGLPSLLAASALLPVGMAVFGALMWSVLYSEDLENDTTNEGDFANDMHQEVERNDDRIRRRSA